VITKVLLGLNSIVMHDEARELLKNHLKRVGNKNVIISERLAARWFNVLNTAVFYNRLKRPVNFEVHKLRGAWGRCVYITEKKHERRPRAIELNDTFASRRMFLDVLVHEMVHCWEHQHHTISGHGKRFMVWKSRIKRTVGLDLLIGVCEDDY